MITLDKKMGALFGTAYGDSLGASTEFKRHPDIVKAWGALGPPDPFTSNGGNVTDDTQMTLAVAEAIHGYPGGEKWLTTALPRRLAYEFLAYYRGQYGAHAHRSPGATVMGSLGRLDRGYMIWMAGAKRSKGCGAIMRVAPVGLVDRPGWDLVYAARLQAAITHRHSTALAAAQMTAWAVHELASGRVALVDLAQALTDYATDARWVHSEAGLPRWLRVTTPAWDEMDAAMANLRFALQVDDRHSDPCLLTGDGWTADECLATALHCLLLFPDDPVTAIRRAAATDGDSDSIAAVTGALAGAAYGMSAWPAWWKDRIEFGAELEGAAAGL